MKKAFSHLTETHIKTLQTKFLFGPEPCIADLLFASELTQLYAMDYPIEKEFPELHQWFQDGPLSEIKSFKKLHDDGEKKLRFVIGFINNLKK